MEHRNECTGRARALPSALELDRFVDDSPGLPRVINPFGDWLPTLASLASRGAKRAAGRLHRHREASPNRMGPWFEMSADAEWPPVRCESRNYRWFVR